MGKKISFNSAILFIQVAIIFSVLLLATEYMQKVNLLNYIQRGFYSTHTEIGYMYNPLSEKNFSLILGKLSEADERFSLHYTLPELSLGIRGVYFGEKAIVPPMLEGRFFTQEEMESTARVVVVGKEKLPNTYTVGEKWFIDIEGTEFEVIGVMGVQDPTRMDKMMWVPFYTAISMTDGMGNIKLDGPNAKSVSGIFGKIAGFLNTVNESHVTQDGFFQTIYNFFTNINHMTYLFILSIFIYLLSFIIVLRWWLNTKNQRIYVQEILGFSRLQIAQDLLLDYSKIFVAAVLVGTLLLCVSSVVKIVNILLCIGTLYLVSLLIFGASMLAKWKNIEGKGGGSE